MRSPFLPDWTFHHAGRRPGAPAIATPSARLTYGELAARVRAFAAHLAAAGISPGQRVLVALPNLPATVVASLAVHALGATAVEASREWSPAVLARVLAQSRPRHAVVWGRDARVWARLAPGSSLERLWIVHGTPLPDALRGELRGLPASLLLDDGRPDPAAPAPPEPRWPALDRDAPALILYTSGSTGAPRGVVQTFRNLDANSRSIVEYLALTERDRALLVLPLHYCYGRSVLQTHLLAGGSVFLEPRTCYPRVVLETLAREGCTGIAGVPVTFEILRRQLDVGSMAFPALRYLTQAGGAMSPDTIAWAREAFRPAQLFVMYGQTEATARLSYLPPSRAEEKRGSIGIPIPGVELQVVDERGGPLPAGAVGHLVARGDNVTPGYLDDPEGTAEILHDGWLWTGDLAHRDADGFFFHRGRSKEMLKIRGHRVSPIEIEHVVAAHPDVAEAAVVGVPHELFGEVAAAVLVLRDGRAPDDAELRRFCHERLPPFAVPVSFRIVAALPRSEAGKLLRRELVASAAATAAEGHAS